MPLYRRRTNLRPAYAPRRRYALRPNVHARLVHRASTVKRHTKGTYSKSKEMVTGSGPTLLEKIASGVGSAARVAEAVLPIVEMINTEAKYFDSTGSGVAHSPGTNDFFVNLTQGIAQGTTSSTRVGDSILAQDIQLRLALNFAASLGPPLVAGLHCRLIIYCWKENLQENPPSNAANIFEVGNNLYSCFNKDFTDQFVVLKDKHFSVNANLNAAGNQSFMHMKIFKKLNWHIRYDGSGAFDGTQNHIFMCLRSSASGAPTGMQCTYYSRLNYTDN